MEEELSPEVIEYMKNRIRREQASDPSQKGKEMKERKRHDKNCLIKDKDYSVCICDKLKSIRKEDAIRISVLQGEVERLKKERDESRSHAQSILLKNLVKLVTTQIATDKDLEDVSIESSCSCWDCNRW